MAVAGDCGGEKKGRRGRRRLAAVEEWIRSSKGQGKAVAVGEGSKTEMRGRWWWWGREFDGLGEFGRLCALARFTVRGAHGLPSLGRQQSKHVRIRQATL